MKILLYIAKLYSIPIFRPLVSYLNSEKIEYAFFISSKIEEQFPHDWDRSKILNSVKQTRIFNPDFVLVSGNFVDFRIPGVKVQIFHGIGIEKEAHYKIRHFFDIYLTSGPCVTERFNTLKEQYGYFDVFETGWLKIDYILNYDIKSFKPTFHIPSDKKIVLYAPTFSNRMQSGSEMIERIDEIISDDEFWIIKFHELMDINLIRAFKNKKFYNTAIIDDFDITPYLHIADIMISDTSSVVYEFMALNKPVITINTISRPDKGINVFSAAELRDALNKIKNNPDILAPNIKKHMSEVNPYLDGNITKKTIDLLRNIDKNIYHKKGKPLNLFRKLQVLHHSFFNKGYLR